MLRRSYRADRYHYTIDQVHPPDENVAAPKRCRTPASVRKAG